MRANMLRQLHRLISDGKVNPWKNRPARMLEKIGVAQRSANGWDTIPNEKTVKAYEEQLAEHTRHKDLALVLEHNRVRRRQMHDERLVRR